MAGTRKSYSGEEKAAILRSHLVDRVPVSDLCDRHGLHPTMFYRWQKTLFDTAATILHGRGSRPEAGRKSMESKIAALEAQLAKKDEIIAEVMRDFIDLKKKLGGS